LSHPADNEKVREAVEHALRTNSDEGDYTYEFRIVRPSDNAVRWLQVNGRTITVADAPPRRVGVTTDVTDRKRDEQTLQEADRRKNDFLATLAHELRNPWRRSGTRWSCCGSRVPCLRTSVGPVEVIDRQARVLTRLVDDLLDISRITQNRLDLRREPASLSAIVEAAVEASKPFIEGRRSHAAPQAA
jgi:signal transduction histidine kinase